MSKTVDVFNLMDHLLSSLEQVGVTEPGQLQRLYAGVGMSVSAQDGLNDCSAIRQHYGALRAQALQGDADALNDLGWLWLNGSRLASNPRLAKRLFLTAARLGSAQALFNLAEQAYFGKGLDVDVPLAIGYYQQAYEAGITCAAQAVGSIYEAGEEGVAADHGKAVAWYKLAAAELEPMACFLLGKLLLDEQSAVYDVAGGLYWLQVAAMQGQVFACERLAEFYAWSFDAPPDPDGAMYRFWQDRAAVHGSSSALEKHASHGECQLAIKR